MSASDEARQSDLAARFRAEHHTRVESYRRDLEMEVRPHFESGSSSDRAAIDTALSAIKAGMLLNGGGLIALPAATSRFALDAGTVRQYLFGAAAAFCGGPLFAWSAYFAAFFWLGSRADSEYLFAGTQGTRVRRRHFPESTPDQMKSGEQSDWSKALRLRQRFQILRYAGAVACFISFAAFAAGTIYGGIRIVHSVPVQQVNLHG